MLAATMVNTNIPGAAATTAEMLPRPPRDADDPMQTVEEMDAVADSFMKG